MRRQLGVPAGGLPLDGLLDPEFVAIDLETTDLDPRRYDVAVLKRARRQRRLPEPHTVALDTRRLAVALYPSWRYRAELEMVAGHFGIPVIGRHTAEGDARLAGNILLALLPEFEKRGARTVDDLAWAQTSVFRRA